MANCHVLPWSGCFKKLPCATLGSLTVEHFLMTDGRYNSIPLAVPRLDHFMFIRS